MTIRNATLIAVAGASVVTACSAEPDGVEAQSCQSSQTLAETSRRPLDLLLVVDTSPGMAGAADNVRINLDRFADVLENLEGGVPDLHLAVVSSNLGAGGLSVAGCDGDGDDGRFVRPPQVPGCTPPDGGFISDNRLPDFQCGDVSGDDCRDRNYEGELRDALACITPVTPSTCEFSQPLDAMKRALDGTHPEHAGFLRPNAFLAVVFISAVDDCSAADPALFDPANTSLGPATAFRCAQAGLTCTSPPLDAAPGSYAGCSPSDSALLHPTEAYADFLRALKVDPGAVIVSGVIGDPGPDITVELDADGDLALGPSCTSAAAEAFPSLRFKQLLDQFPARNTLTVLCNESLQDAFIQIAEAYRQVLSSPCLNDVDVADIDPAPGLQLACEVEFAPSDASMPERIAPCVMDGPEQVASDTPLPCWWSVLDDEQCLGAPRYRVERDAFPLVPGAVIARCETACPDTL